MCGNYVYKSRVLCHVCTHNHLEPSNLDIHLNFQKENLLSLFSILEIEYVQQLGCQHVFAEDLCPSQPAMPWPHQGGLRADDHLIPIL